MRNACDDVSFFTLEHKFSTLETGLVNPKLSSLGLSKWNDRLTIINNIYRYHEIYSHMSLIHKYAEKISDTEFKLLTVVAVQEKAFSLIANVLGLSPKSVDELVEKVSPVIECVDTDSAEYHEHSAKKVYANSKPWLFRIISEYYEIKGNYHVGSVLFATIKDLWARKEFKNIAKSLTKFDALNELFGMKRAGVSGLILDLYKDLSSIMSSYDDYWLQRAKACLHMSNDKAILKEGVGFATKIVNDDREFNVVFNARFILALLYSKLVFLEKYENEGNVIKAIYWVAVALEKSHVNIRYVNSMLDNHKGRESWVMSLYNYLGSPNLPASLLLERSKISVISGYIEEHLRKKTDKGNDVLKKTARRRKWHRR